MAQFNEIIARMIAYPPWLCVTARLSLKILTTYYNIIKIIIDNSKITIVSSQMAIVITKIRFVIA